MQTPGLLRSGAAGMLRLAPCRCVSLIAVACRVWSTSASYAPSPGEGRRIDVDPGGCCFDITSVVRTCLQRATQPTNKGATPASGGAGMETYASRLSARSVGGNSSSGNCSKSDSNVACTRLLDRATRSSSRSKVPRRARIRACRPMRREGPDRHRSSRESTVLVDQHCTSRHVRKF